MSYWANKKVNKTKNYIINAMLRNTDYDNSKENIFGLARSMANRADAAAHYLYENPTFVGSFPMEKLSKRLKGGQCETETYYDCQSSSCKEIVGDNQLSCHNVIEPPQPPSQPLRLDDISGDIENAKEFKKALKQMALSSNALYRTFRLAYAKNQKSKRISNETSDERYCLKCGGEKSCENIAGEMEYNNDVVNPFNVVNVVLPTNNETSCSKCQVTTSKSSQNLSNCCSKDTGLCSASKKRNVIDTSCQTCCEPVKCCNNTIKISQEDISKLPIVITVPLNVEIDSKGRRAHIIGSEIVIETLADGNEQKHCIGPSTGHTPIEQDCKMAQVDSNAFHSGTSRLLETGGNESSISTVPNSNDFSPCIPKLKETECNECSKNVPTPIRTVPNSSDYYPCIPRFKGTEIKQNSVQNLTTKRLGPKKEVEVAKPQISKPLTNLELLKMKTERLRAELVQEIKMTLEHNTPLAAIHELELPANVRRKNEINAASIKFTLPDGNQERNIEQDPKIINSGTQTSIAESNISAMQPNSRYKRNELRTQIQTQLKELLQPYKFILQKVYDTEERNAILLDFQRIFHPEVSNMLSEEIRLAEAEQGIRYILEPQQPQNSPDESVQLPESAIDLLEDIRHILNLKPRRREKSKYKKYHREAKETILEGLQTILKPRKDQALQVGQEIRDIVLHDLNVMLRQEPRQQHKQELKQEAKQQPKQDLKQESSNQKFTEIREGVLADLRLMLNVTSDTVMGHNEPNTSGSPENQEQITSTQINEIRDGLLAELRRMLDASPHLRAENIEEQEHVTQHNNKPTFSKYSSIDSLRDNKKRYE